MESSLKRLTETVGLDETYAQRLERTSLTTVESLRAILEVVEDEDRPF
ncbi:MAG: hypothetical protein RMH74_06430 [Candidatus Caldarchaeum sp.]|nr:hypothetical protein [Candidatus Caldarchaeum sp.]